MDFITAERDSMRSLDSKLSAERAPYLKQKLRQALNLLDEYDKTGSDTLLHMALKAHQDVVDAIGNRRPENVEEMPRENHPRHITTTTSENTCKVKPPLR